MATAPRMSALAFAEAAQAKVSERTSLVRSVSSRRRSIFATALEARPSTSSASYVPNPEASAPGDCLPWDRVDDEGRLLKRQGTTIFEDSFEATLKEEHPEAHQTLTSPFLGFLFQAACLVAAINCYVGGPLVVQWAKTTGWNKGGTPGKRET